MKTPMAMPPLLHTDCLQLQVGPVSAVALLVLSLLAVRCVAAVVVVSLDRDDAVVCLLQYQKIVVVLARADPDQSSWMQTCLWSC